jgi:alpha-D-ribose 1-methylphosphonate 5-triphosphate diphosphatase
MDFRDRLLDVVRTTGVDLVVFADTLNGLVSRAESRWDELCRQAALRGISTDLHLDTLRALSKRDREIPRFLCHLSEQFDSLGVIYGSLSDGDGETREVYSMMGARLCLKPRVRAAAALARAVGDPVVLSARDVVARPGTEQGMRPIDMIRAGLCTAICSDGGFDALVPAAFAAAERGGLGLPAAWALVSRNPADIMRLPDRGVLDHGRRADLVIVDAASRRVEATIAAGRLTYLTGEAANRFMGAPAALEHAAQ